MKGQKNLIFWLALASALAPEVAAANEFSSVVEKYGRGVASDCLKRTVSLLGELKSSFAKPEEHDRLITAFNSQIKEIEAVATTSATPSSTPLPAPVQVTAPAVAAMPVSLPPSLPQQGAAPLPVPAAATPPATVATPAATAPAPVAANPEASGAQAPVPSLPAAPVAK